MDTFVTRTRKRKLDPTGVKGKDGGSSSEQGERNTEDEGGLEKRLQSCSGLVEDDTEFTEPLPWKKIEAEGLDCDYTLLFHRLQADSHFQQLEKEVEYFSGDLAKVQVFGKFHNIPRKQATYGDPGLNYSFSGVKLMARPWTPVLEIIRDQITKATGHTFNFVLVNRYKDGNDHIGEHQDDERELDPACPIAAVSFGAVRDLVFRHQEARGKNAARKIEPVKVALQHGSLLLMNWPTNVNWYHSLPVRKKVLTPRISLTFRRVIKRHKSQK
ncbi:DNA oxidative demethylase ALKBH2-like [Acipenser oxyrinchus oxyrinchus]|uniref:DNA oxidative demethylase ALKBH2 n=1 Tax=Acipenser oxyrinchus oxyrinchus TaxID=40147 RepID=A0AAD8D0E4_ACIOX|nr:DNA oxidative demethylase ALKBH2-like [Acipenser oxyrinchus oxyrinchus]